MEIARVQQSTELERLRLSWARYDVEDIRDGALLADGSGVAIGPNLPAGRGVSIGAAIRQGCGVGVAGGFLAECIGQSDYIIASRAADKIRRKMFSSGKINTSEATFAAAIADACAAIARVRSFLLRHPLFRVGAGMAARVAWRAVVRSTAHDGYGTAGGAVVSVEPHILADYRASGINLPPLVSIPMPSWCGDDSRDDKASRLLFERARAKRPALLRRRIDSLLSAAVGSGSDKRRSSIERVSVGCQRLLAGASFDDASRAAGYASGPTWLARDGFEQAVFRVVGRPSFGRGVKRVEVRQWFPVYDKLQPSNLRTWCGFGVHHPAGAVRHLAGRRALAAVSVALRALPASQPATRVDGWLYWLAREHAARIATRARAWVPATRQASFVGARFTSALRARRAAAAASIIASERARVAQALVSPLPLAFAWRRLAVRQVLAWRWQWQDGTRARVPMARAAMSPGNHIASPGPSRFEQVTASAEFRPCGRVIPRRFAVARDGSAVEQAAGVLVSTWQGADVVGLRYVADVATPGDSEPSATSRKQARKQARAAEVRALDKIVSPLPLGAAMARARRIKRAAEWLAFDIASTRATTPPRALLAWPVA